MRRELSFLILLVVGIALGAYIYFVERKRPASDEPEQKPKVFAEVQEADIEEIVVSGDAQTTRLTKADGKWRIVSPITADADTDQVNNLTGNFATLERSDVVDENPRNLKEFGLEPPRAEVAFRTKGSRELRRLRVGNKAPTGGELYAQVEGEKRVILISGFMEAVFVRSTFDLRNKAILAFERDKVERLEIAAADRALTLTHAPSDWKITRPLNVRADFGTAEGLVGRLSTAQMRSVVSDETPAPGALQQYGLAEPAITVTLTAGSARAVLKIGRTDPAGNYYAMDTARPLVFTVEPSLVDDLKKSPADFRRKDLFEFRPFNATRVEVTRNGQPMAFELVKNADPKAVTTDKWRQVSPARDLDRQKMDSFLSAFSNLRIDTWADKSDGLGLDSPQLAFVVTFEDGKKEERVLFARKGDEVHATRSDEPGAGKIPTSDYDAALRALDDLLK